MPSAFKDFDRAAKEQLGGRPTFVLGGSTWTCRARLPFRKTSLMMAAMDKLNEDDATIDNVVSAIEDFFTLALIRSQREAFIKALNDDPDNEDDDAAEDSTMGFREVQKAMTWLMDHYMSSNDADEVKSPNPNGSEITPESPPNGLSSNPDGSIPVGRVQSSGT